MIGVVAYFEAFCGDHFASILNLCPQLLVRLKEKGRDVSLDATDLLDPGLQSHRLGSIVAERYDFGTPQSINSLYQHLLQITPFSAQERKRYEQILNDRNLLVHHGGILTMKYANQGRAAGERVHYDSIRVSKRAFLEITAFLEGIVKDKATMPARSADVTSTRSRDNAETLPNSAKPHPLKRDACSASRACKGGPEHLL